MFRIKLVLFLSLLLICSSINAQCDSCGGDIGIVPEDRSLSFRENYRNRFWKSSADSIKYSESVEFSRAELNRFFSRNSSSDYCGFNVYFLSGDLTSRDNHKNSDQIGLALVPRMVKKGLPDFRGYLAESFAFNLKGGHSNRGGVYRPIDTARIDTLRARYKKSNPLGSDSIHTRYVLVGEQTMNFLKAFLSDRRYSQYKTFRFYFICYHSDDVVCGQSDANQISILIAPVSISGPDFSVFESYFGALKKKKPAKMMLNHGSLCPNYCPDGDNN